MVANGLHERKKRAAVAKWRASGLSQAEFCRREGLQQWQLSEWKRFVEVLGSPVGSCTCQRRRRSSERISRQECAEAE